jgi:hypothetical protein
MKLLTSLLSVAVVAVVIAGCASSAKKVFDPAGQRAMKNFEAAGLTLDTYTRVYGMMTARITAKALEKGADGRMYCDYMASSCNDAFTDLKNNTRCFNILKDVENDGFCFWKD